MLFHTGNMFKEIINVEVPVRVFQDTNSFY